MVFHRLLQNISILKLTVKIGLKNIAFAPLENPKIEIFFANNSPKKIGGRKFGI